MIDAFHGDHKYAQYLVSAQYIRGGRVFEVLMKSEAQAALLVQNGLFVPYINKLLTFSPTQTPTINVSVKGAPIAMPLDNIVQIVAQYGTVVDRADILRKQNNLRVRDGIRLIKFARLERPIPKTLVIGGRPCLVQYEGQDKALEDQRLANEDLIRQQQQDAEDERRRKEEEEELARIDAEERRRHHNQIYEYEAAQQRDTNIHNDDNTQRTADDEHGDIPSSPDLSYPATNEQQTTQNDEQEQMDHHSYDNSRKRPSAKTTSDDEVPKKGGKTEPPTDDQHDEHTDNDDQTNFTLPTPTKTSRNKVLKFVRRTLNNEKFLHRTWDTSVIYEVLFEMFPGADLADKDVIAKMENAFLSLSVGSKTQDQIDKMMAWFLHMRGDSENDALRVSAHREEVKTFCSCFEQYSSFIMDVMDALVTESTTHVAKVGHRYYEGKRVQSQ